MPFVPPMGVPLPANLGGGLSVGGLPQPPATDPEFNGLMDRLAQPDSQTSIPAIVPPAANLSQPADAPGIPSLEGPSASGPMLGPGAPGPISSAGQLFKPLADWLGEVNTSDLKAKDLEQKLADGENVDVHDVMVASEEAGIGLSLTTEIRNRLLDAYQEVMRMQV